MKGGEEDELQATEMLNQHPVWQEPLSEGDIIRGSTELTSQMET